MIGKHPGRQTLEGCLPKHSEAAMEALKAYGQQLGLSPDEAEAALRMHRPAADGSLVVAADVGKDALAIAHEVMEQDRVLEYSCYDNAGAPQGKAVIRLKDWEDKEEGVVIADHGECSDEYYQWYANHDLTRGDGAVFHVCTTSHQRCKFKLPRRDRRTVIHLDTWRLMTPASMLAIDYLKNLGNQMGKSILKKEAEEKKAQARAPQGVGPAGSGIDAALHQAGGAVPAFPPPAPPGEERGRDKRSASREGRDRKKRGNLAEHIRRNVQRSQEAERSRSRKKKGKKKKEKKERGRKKRDSSEESSGGSSTSGSTHFRSTSARGGDLWRLAQKKPGHLAERSLNEMIRFLAERSEVGSDGKTWAGQKVMAYLSQVVMANHPPSKMGMRSHRELVTLAMAVDEILAGQFQQALDLLLQRFKAVEASLVDGNWSTAKHLEIIPPAAASLTTEEERARAAKAELSSLKLKEAMNKASKSK